jgi:hypothetical protein
MLSRLARAADSLFEFAILATSFAGSFDIEAWED